LLLTFLEIVEITGKTIKDNYNIMNEMNENARILSAFENRLRAGFRSRDKVQRTEKSDW